MIFNIKVVYIPITFKNITFKIRVERNWTKL